MRLSFKAAVSLIKHYVTGNFKCETDGLILAFKNMELIHNDLVKGTSGRIGDQLVYRQRSGKTIIAKRQRSKNKADTILKFINQKTWLFEGQQISEKYDERSLAEVMKQALIKAKINKPASLHWLRHSYATQSGTDLRYIQEILDHKSSRTTEVYTHASTKSLQNAKSPFDDL